ncbi:hydroxypyruvate isomerase family protein [Cytobacillus sp. FJAT-54145]|uniref:Hydroxypyruvate isomerase family protein n=1 Tax=Cytobacillus spartinae TaxID=3299023 RepID=A0ABW6K6P3_9BACI
MNRLACNLSTIFTEVPLLERFEKAKKAGFSHVECQFPYAISTELIIKEMNTYNLKMALINFPPGNWEAGERGIAIFPDRVNEFKKSVELAIEYATSLEVTNIHCMAGILPSSLDESIARNVFIKNIEYAAEKLAQHHMNLLLEPINRMDMPNYFLSNIHEAVGIIKEIGLPNIKLQFDFYHIKRLQEDLFSSFEDNFTFIGHVQIADSPGRNEPGTGEIPYDQVFQLLERIGYNGLIGLEYTPKERSEDSFNWVSGLKKGGILL